MLSFCLTSHDRGNSILESELLFLKGDFLVALLVGQVGETGEVADEFVESVMLRNQLPEVFVGSEQHVFYIGLVRELCVSHARLLFVEWSARLACVVERRFT
jgi:hypothetical protein